MKTKILFFLTAAVSVASVLAAPLNNDGNITATNNNYVKATTDVLADRDVKAANCYVKAQTYFYTPGYLQVGTSGSFGTTLTVGSTIYAGNTITSNVGVTGNGYVSTNGYFSAIGAGKFGDYLRVGGNPNTPAAKSVQIGQFATATSFGSLVVGRYNVEEGTSGSWVPTEGAKEPLFVAGNGTGPNVGDRNNAFTIYKDGTVTMSKAQGDILMGPFGN